MSRQVWKFKLEVCDSQLVRMPSDAQLLSVQAQYDEPHLWALVDPSKEREDRWIRIVGTGHPCDFSADGFIGTFQLMGGRLVFHVFEVLDSANAVNPNPSNESSEERQHKNKTTIEESSSSESDIEQARRTR